MKKISACLIIAAIICSCQPKVPRNTGKRPQPTATEKLTLEEIIQQGFVLEKHFTDKLAFSTYMHKPIVEIRFSDKGKTYRFLLDTGAPNMIKKELADELGLNKIMAADGVHANSTNSYDIVMLDTVIVGNTHFLNTAALITSFDRSPNFKCLGNTVDGIIGSNLMLKAKWELNYGNDSITITDKRNSLTNNKKSIVVPIETNFQGTLFASLRVNNFEIPVCIDNGSAGSFSIQKQFLSQIIPSKIWEGYGQLYSTFSGVKVDTAYNVKIQYLNLGNKQLTNEHLNFLPRSNSIIGNRFLEQYINVFDWDYKEVILTPLENYQADEVGFGLKYTLSGENLTVSMVYENTPAWETGIAYGDTIMAINGEELKHLSLDDYCQMKQSYMLNQASDTLRICIIKNGERKTALLKK